MLKPKTQGQIRSFLDLELISSSNAAEDESTIWLTLPLSISLNSMLDDSYARVLLAAVTDRSGPRPQPAPPSRTGPRGAAPEGRHASPRSSAARPRAASGKRAASPAAESAGSREPGSRPQRGRTPQGQPSAIASRGSNRGPSG